MTVKNIPSLRATEGSVAIHSTLVLRLAFSCSTRGKCAYVLSALRTPLAHANATARACNQERGLACRALDSTQDKPCSVALLGLAFTMAEILLSLTIIGVVAAITLPSLTGNINERTWQTQGKALFSRMSQAIALMPSLNGYGTLTAGTTSTSAIDTAAETFVTNGLAKVLKINNICDNEHLQDCGIPDSYVAQGGSKRDFPTTLSELNSKIVGSNGLAIDVKAAAFETANGESIAVFYNPQCRAYTGATNYYAQQYFCVNFVYDLNGTKGPNTVGKDIGYMTAFNPSDSTISSPVFGKILAGVSYTNSKAVAACRKLGNEYRLPTRDEMASLFYNMNFVLGDSTGFSYQYQIDKQVGNNTFWRFGGDGKIWQYVGGNVGALCVKTR